MAIKNKITLVIDDDPDFCAYVRAILEAQGMTVIAVMSINEAKNVLENEVPSVILLDMELQNEFGTDFLKERSENTLWSKIPVIVCSSQNLAAVVKAAIRFGADDYLLKPIKQTWLIQRVRKALLKEGSLSYFFKPEEEIEILIEASPVSINKTSIVARSSMGFEKGAYVSATIPDPKGSDVPIIAPFKSDEKSRFHFRGPFDTLFSTAAITETEKNRVQLLKTFWKS